MEPAEGTTKPRLHLAHIDGLRALCALWVLLYHAAAVSGIPLPFALRWIGWGHFAVPAFIVISGFCLMMPVVRSGELKGGAVNFYRKRIRRILPPYYAAALLFIALHRVTNKNDIVTHLLLLHNFSPDTFYGNINYSFWSIAVECQIYVLFPLFVLAWRSQGAFRVVSATLLLSYLANTALRHTSLWGLCLHYSGLFAIGAAGAICAFSAQAQIVRFRERFAWTAAAFGLAVVLLLLIGRLGHPPRNVFNDMTWVSGPQISLYNLFIAATTACLLVAATVRNNTVRRTLSWTPLVWLGSFSYSFYLLHQPFVNVFWQRVGPRLARHTALLIFAALVIPGIIGISYLFHRLIERPFMSGHPKTDRQAEQAAIDSPAP